jgi:hypothetical protein
MAVIWILGAVCAVIAFVVVRIEAHLDRRDFLREYGAIYPNTWKWRLTKGSAASGMQWAYGGIAVVACLPLFLGLMSAVLHADVPLGDPCSLLEEYSWKWLLLGCLWGG